jgi:hypothetical protein
MRRQTRPLPERFRGLPVRSFLGIVLAFALATAGPAWAQSTTAQSGRPQPPPAQKPAAQPAPATAPVKPQTTVAKPGGGQAAKPGPDTAQAKGAKAPPPKKKVPPQTFKVWKGRGFAVVGAGAQVMGPGYTSTSTFKVHAEDASLNADASIGIGPVFGARGGVRVWKNLAIGGGLAVASTSQSLDVTGRLPHPFQFNQFRPVEGTADGLARLETMVAFEASWLMPVTRRIDMFVFGGPAYIRVRQDMATKIKFTESYPFDSATFTGVETASLSGGGIGATAGVDVAYLLTRRVGIGGELRYSYARTTLTPSAQPARVPLGGLQVAFAARLLF